MAGETILVVEDEPSVSRGLVYGLEAEGFRTVLAEDGQTALKQAHETAPQLILLDLRLPDMSGFDVCRELRRKGYRQPILILTALDDELDKVLGLELGADDYVLKPYSLRELVARIRAQLRRAYGELAASEEGGRLTFGDIEIDLEGLQVIRRNRPVFLTPTEFRLLRYLVVNPNRPITRETLIERVWGYDSDLGNARTVDVHIRHLREKLEDDPADPRWIVTVRGFGYKFNLAVDPRFG